MALPNVVRELLGPLLAGQLPVDTFIRLVLLLLPFSIYYALPMGVLTGVLLTLGRLSADSEITAMRAAGISVSRIARPVFVLGAACTALALYVNFESMPWARQQYYRELALAIRADPLRIIVPKTFIRDFSGCVLYVGEKEGSVLRDIWIWELDAQARVKRLVRAESGRVTFDEANNRLIPTLVRAKAEERDTDNPEDFGKSPKVMSFAKVEELQISLDRYFGRTIERKKPDYWFYSDLRAKQAELDAKPAPDREKARETARERMKLSLVIHERITMALAVFSFALIGVPLGIKVSRRETSANLGVALLLVLGFYLMTVVVQWLDRHPEYRPDILLWVPNVLFIGLGAWMFSRIDRR